VAYYVPSLCQIAFLARQRAALTPPSWARTARQAVCLSAAAELVLTLGRSAIMVTVACGMRVSGTTIGAVGTLQGIAVICGIGALASGPAVMLISPRRCP
jgi:hypothetical protein